MYMDVLTDPFAFNAYYLVVCDCCGWDSGEPFWPYVWGRIEGNISLISYSFLIAAF